MSQPVAQLEYSGLSSSSSGMYQSSSELYGIMYARVKMSTAGTFPDKIHWVVFYNCRHLNCGIHFVYLL